MKLTENDLGKRVRSFDLSGIIVAVCKSGTEACVLFDSCHVSGHNGKVRREDFYFLHEVYQKYGTFYHVLKPGSNGRGWFLYVDDLEFIEKAYDPKQAGDTDDDV